MRDPALAPSGRYACGCRTEYAAGRHGVLRMVCLWHGEGLGLGTAFMRRLRSILRI